MSIKIPNRLFNKITKNSPKKPFCMVAPGFLAREIRRVAIAQYFLLGRGNASFITCVQASGIIGDVH